MVKETPLAEVSIEWESSAAGGGSEIHRGSRCEPCHGLIQGVPWDTCLDQTPSQHPTLVYALGEIPSTAEPTPNLHPQQL